MLQNCKQQHIMQSDQSTIMAPVMDDIMAPIMEQIMAPMEDIMAPIMEEIMAPIMEDIMAPIMEQIMLPIMGPIMTPIMESIMTPAVASTSDVIMLPIMQAQGGDNIMQPEVARGRLCHSFDSPLGAVFKPHAVFWEDEDRDCDFRSKELCY